MLNLNTNGKVIYALLFPNVDAHVFRVLLNRYT
jgi:hypothetical protein